MAVKGREGPTAMARQDSVLTPEGAQDAAITLPL